MKKILLVKIGLISSLSVVIWSGCNSKIKLADFKPKRMEKSRYIPTKEMLTIKNKKVAILKVNNSGVKLAKELNLGEIISQQLKSDLSLIGTPFIVTNSSKSNINKTEFKYIIDGKINDTTYEYKLLAPAPSITITGKTVMMPARHEYTACSNGIIDIYKLPSLQIAKSIPFDKCKVESECAKKRVRTNNSTLIKDSARVAIKSISVDLKNFFAQKGYILEQRSDGKKNIVKTTLGKDSDAKEGSEVKFYTKNESGSILVGNGQISNQITEDSSWVIVENLTDGVELKSGDFIKIKYKKGFFD